MRLVLKVADGGENLEGWPDVESELPDGTSEGLFILLPEFCTSSPLTFKVAYLTAMVEFVLGAPHLGGHRSEQQVLNEANNHG